MKTKYHFGVLALPEIELKSNCSNIWLWTYQNTLQENQ